MTSQNAVYGKLVSSAKFKYVLGLDIGHGETVVYKAEIKTKQLENKTSEIYPDINKIPVNSAGDHRIPTMIGFDKNGKVTIGRKAMNMPGFYQHFKANPSMWNTLYGDKCTHGDLMEHFVRALWEGIMQYNSELEQAVKDNKLLIAVGCPSSPSWTEPKAVECYQNLITRATGCPFVTVMAESTAAIMSAVLDANEINNKNEKLYIQTAHGLVVIDAGSSTIDFTYVLLGKKLITRSLTVAGHDLDEQILAMAIENTKKTVPNLIISDEQMPDLMVQIRQLKEEFYPELLSQGRQLLSVWGYNSQGQVDKNVDGGRLDFVVNADLMDRALNRKSIQLNAFDPAKSWADRLRKFIRDCRALIGCDANGKILCDNVILTGGTSKVTKLQDIVKEEYTNDKHCQILESRDSSASVAKGLCYAKCMEIKGGNAVDLYKKDIDELAVQGYEVFIGNLSQYMTKQTCDDIQLVIERYIANGERITAGTLLDEINKRVRKNQNLTGAGCQQQVEELFLLQLQSAQNKIHEKANLVSKNIYGAENSHVPEISHLTDAELKRMISKLNISAVINSNWLNTVVTSINFTTIQIILAIMAIITAEIPPVSLTLAAMSLLVDSNAIQQRVMQFILRNKTNIPRWMLRRIGNNVTASQKRKDLESKSVRKTLASMKKEGILKNEFVTAINQQAEAALGKVLFMVYEEEPDTQ